MNEAHDHGVSEIVKVTQKSAKKNVIESKSKAGGKYKKAPGAPRRFKSAFIFFSTEKHKEIRQGLGLDGAKEKVECLRRKLQGDHHGYSRLTINSIFRLNSSDNKCRQDGVRSMEIP